MCNGAEDCATCPRDCGLCETCGDGRCDDTEACDSCPADCGICETCGDGFCRTEDGEDCLTCAPDCGDCPRCGDGVCSPEISETCFTCEDDCGRCPSCGDGVCRGTETCASCNVDCAVCSVCGNMRCESEGGFESCINCAEDCGSCALRSCGESLTCVFGCIDFGGGGGPPGFDVSCVSDCASLTCPDSQSFLNNVVSCTINSFFSGACGMGGGLACVMRECAGEIRACLGDPGC